MSEAGLMSPNTDILTTPKESLKTPKFTEFSGGKGLGAECSLNTPLALTTPLLSTPTLTTPRTADWGLGLFSPLALGPGCPGSPGPGRDSRPADLPLDSSIGLSSPHDGVLAKRRKLKNAGGGSGHSRSVESDSNRYITDKYRQVSKFEGVIQISVSSINRFCFLSAFPIK